MASREPVVAAHPGKVAIPWVRYDLSGVGYEEAEFLLDGSATSYELVGDHTADGQWDVVEGAAAEYTTRVVVRRPTDSASFSGTVVVEWLNVSGGLDFAPDWNMVHREIIRAGHAWVGVSAQHAGVEGGGLFFSFPLKETDPARYGALAHPGDAWAFDIFSQVGALLRGPSGDEVLPGLRPRQILAVGQSQSAMFLSTYINAVDPVACVYDGFLVRGRAAAAATAQGGLPLLEDPSRTDRIRDDARVPVILLQTETDVVLLGSGRSEQPDGPNLRLWELAGTAHADLYLVGASEADNGTLTPAELAAAMRPTRDMLWGKLAAPANAAPQHHYIAQAALRWLDQWAAGGSAPPGADRLRLAPDRTHFAVDDVGLVVGGVRSPWVDVPVAVLSGLCEGGDIMSALFGSTVPFDAATLRALYPGGGDDYLAQFTASLDEAITRGFVLDDDRAEILAVAAAAWELEPAGTGISTPASKRPGT